MATNRPTKPQQSPSMPQPSLEVPAAEPAVVSPAVEQAETPENPLLQALANAATQIELFQELSAQADAARSISFDLLAATIGDDLFISMLDALQLEGRDSFPETEWRAIVTLHAYIEQHKLNDPKAAITRLTQPQTAAATAGTVLEPMPQTRSNSNGNGNGKKPNGSGSDLLPQQAQQAMQQGLGKLQRQIRQQGTEIGVQLGFTMLDTVADTAAATVYAALSRELGEDAPQHLKERHEQTKQKFAALDEVVRGAFTRPQSGGEYGSQYLQDGLEEGEEVLPLSAEIANLFSQESSEPLFNLDRL